MALNSDSLVLLCHRAQLCSKIIQNALKTLTVPLENKRISICNLPSVLTLTALLENIDLYYIKLIY